MTSPAPVFASASVVGQTLQVAIDAVAARVRERLGGPADAAFLFVSAAAGEDVSAAGAHVRERLGAPRLVGCTGAWVCETAGEHENSAGVALLAFRAPGAGLAPLRLTQDLLASSDGPGPIRDAVGLDESAGPTFVLLSDPFTLDPERMLRRIEEAYPGAPVVGGLASGATRPGVHRLHLDDASHAAGAVGLALTGMRVRTVVSQGCRPVGRRFVVTKLKEGRVLQLSGKPALDALEGELARMSEPDRALARTNLLVGRAAHEARDDFGRGDFLVRNLVGFVPAERSIVVGDRLRLGQTLQFQLRDRGAAEEDLDLLLEAARLQGPAAGALAFVCAGRGTSLFGRPGADVLAVRRHFGDVPLAGFACSGELGPVGGRSFVHGFTASVAFF